MEGEELKRVLAQVTEDILARMRTEGFVYKRRRRYDPLVWDIGNGWCEAWAKRAAELTGGTWQYMARDSAGQWVGHSYLVLGDPARFYDADCLDGVDDPEKLPMVTHPAAPRPEPGNQRQREEE